MTPRLTVAQLACGLVAGVGVALGATGGLMLAGSFDERGATPVVIAQSARDTSRSTAAVTAVGDGARAAPPVATRPARNRAAATRRHASRQRTRPRAQRRAAHARSRPAPKPRVVQRRQTVPVVTTAPRPVPVSAPVTTRAPAPRAPARPKAPPPKPAPKPTSAGSGGTFDDSG